MSIKPKASHSVKYTIPEHIRDANPLFVKFFEHYYTWMEQNGQPLDIVQNLVEYNDIDTTTDFFATMIMKSLLKILPPSVVVNKKTLTKNIKNFFASKGSEDSFKFMMNAIFNETAEVKWQRDYVFRASGNEATRECHVAIESDAALTDVDGCDLVQPNNFARGTIESCTTTLVNGKYINWIMLNEKTINGEFYAYEDVKILKNNINRGFFEVTDYYGFVQVSDSVLVVRSPTNIHSSVANLVIRQVGTNASAEVGSLSSTYFSNDYFYVINITSKTGTWNTNDIYFLSSSLLNYHFTKNDYYYGTVSPCVERLSFSDYGQNYTIGQAIDFTSGSGANVEAEISEVSGGGIDDIKIISPGHSYVVGDVVTANSNDGAGLNVKVGSIDGIGAAAYFTMEVEDFQFVGNSVGIEVGDKLTLLDGVCSTPFLITPTSISSTGNVLTYTLDQRGEYITCPDAWNNSLTLLSSVSLLIDGGADAGFHLLDEHGDALIQDYSTNNVNLKYRIKSSHITNTGHHYSRMLASTVGGFGTGANIVFTPKNGVITSIPVITGGSGYTKAYVTIQNGSGIGFVGQCSILAGSINAITIIDGGSDYSVGNTITILGDGTSASVAAFGSGHISNGVVKSAVVLNSGSDYPYDTTISYTTSNGGAVACSLTPVNDEGKITSVTINSGGSGYTTSNNTLTVSSGTLAVITPSFSGTGLALLTDQDVDGSKLLSESSDTLIQDTTVSSSNSIVGVNILNAGYGYVDPSEVVPLTFDITTSTGTGALIVPVLEAGRLVDAKIVRGGSGYDVADTVAVVGGGGTDAFVEFQLLNGSFVNVFVSNRGHGYQYGTKAYVLGDGQNADITTNIDTSITEVSIVNSGYSYLPNTTLTVVDPNPSATGAVLFPVIVDGKIVDIIVANRGLYYTNPTVQINGVGYAGQISATVNRNIKSITYNNFGFDYTSAYLLFISDGKDGKLEVVVDNFGSLKEISTTTGSGYTSTPLFSAVDNSNYGAVSGLNILDGGFGFRKPISLTIDETITKSGAYFVGFGSGIGQIKQVNFKSFGADYYELPRPIFPISALMSKNDAFIVGETARIKDFGYLDTSVQSYSILTEAAEPIELEDSAYNLLSEYKINIAAGPEIVVAGFNFATNQMFFTRDSTKLDLISEVSEIFITENGFVICHEESESLTPGDVVVGQKSGASSTILRLDRAQGQAVQGGFGYNNRKFVNVVGLLNNVASKLGNNYDIHDFAYKIKSGLSQNTYETFLKKTVHPAGYSMFGEIEIRSQNPNDVAPHLPNQTISDMFTIIMTLDALSLGILGVNEWKSFEWLDNNKFRIHALDYGYLVMEGDNNHLNANFNLNTEDGEILVGDGLVTYYPGHDISFYFNETFKTVDPAEINYNYNGTTMDFSCEIDVVTQ